MLLKLAQPDILADEVLVLRGRFTVERRKKKRRRRQKLASAIPVTPAEKEEIEFPCGPKDDPLAVRVNGTEIIFGKVQYRLLRWLYWHWKREGRETFDFAEAGEEVWNDDLTDRDTSEAARF